ARPPRCWGGAEYHGSPGGIAKSSEPASIGGADAESAGSSAHARRWTPAPSQVIKASARPRERRFDGFMAGTHEVVAKAYDPCADSNLGCPQCGRTSTGTVEEREQPRIARITRISYQDSECPHPCNPCNPWSRKSYRQGENHGSHELHRWNTWFLSIPLRSTNVRFLCAVRRFSSPLSHAALSNCSTPA